LHLRRMQFPRFTFEVQRGLVYPSAEGRLALRGEDLDR